MKNRILALLTALAMLLCILPAALATTATETAVVTGTGTAQGYGGDVTVTMTLADGEITIVEIVGDAETQGIGSKVVEEWPQAFVEANDGLVLLDTQYAVEDYAIAIALENTELLDKINAALEELIADGTVAAIVAKYIPAE